MSEEAKKARCWDKSWHYTRSDFTDLASLFKRIRRQQAEASKKPAPKVTPIKKAKEAK